MERVDDLTGALMTLEIFFGSPVVMTNIAIALGLSKIYPFLMGTSPFVMGK